MAIVVAVDPLLNMKIGPPNSRLTPHNLLGTVAASTKALGLLLELLDHPVNGVRML